jgi:hypothetical protein
MASVKEYVSPDSVLRLIVHTDDSGDVAIGFANTPWHTHASILATLSELPEDEAVHEYVHRVVSGEAVIRMLSVNGKLSDLWVSDDPAADAKHAIEGESIEMRYWNGESWKDPL